MKHGLGRLTSVVVAGAMFACSGDNGQGGAGAEIWVQPDLAPLASCGDTERSVRSALLGWMNRRIDENLESFLATAGGDCGMDVEMAAGAPQMPTSPAQSTSSTNNQVPGVDEADFVKNDDQYVYVVTGGALHIVDVSAPASAHEVSRVTLQGEPKKLLLAGDRVVVFSSMPKPVDPGDPQDPYAGAGAGAPAPYEPESDCTYGYDCDFTGDGHPVKMSVFDVTNRTEPRLIRELDLSSSLISARSIGSTIHAVVHHSTGFVTRRLELWPWELEECGNFSPIQGAIAFEALRAKNAEIIASASLSELMPRLVDTRLADGSENKTDLAAECQGFYRSPLGDGDGFLTLLSFDATQNGPASTSTIVSRPGATYVTAESLYVAVRQTQTSGMPWFTSAPGSTNVTTVHKFALDSEAAGSSYAASGLVTGGVLNQFSLDEWQGHLRIATTSGLGSTAGNTVSVLRQEGSSLTRVGEVNGIAPGEDIRSVRFDGARGFVVTFRQTDPLHVLDLAEPKAPRVAGELVIPGFSTYLHMMDDTHLLGIGMSGNGGGSLGGVKLSLYDVGVPATPAELHSESMSFASASAAVTDHLAFNFFAPSKLLAVPYGDCASSLQASGLAVYDVDIDAGFSLRGKLEFPAGSSDSSYYYGSDCGSWWAHSTSRVKRSIIAGEHVIGISDDWLQVASLDAVSEKIIGVPLGNVGAQ